MRTELMRKDRQRGSYEHEEKERKGFTVFQDNATRQKIQKKLLLEGEKALIPSM
jgi:hypothetical protein